MKPEIRKLFTKLGSAFNMNVNRNLSKKYFPLTLRNITNVTKAHNTDLKSKQLVAKYHSLNQSQGKISIGAYCLLSVPIGAFMLGTWQVQRYQWKLDLIEKLTSRTRKEPTELPSNLEELESKEYYPIKVRGTFLYDKEFTVGYRGLIMDGKSVERSNKFMSSETQRGYHVITPFKLADRNLTILVNRGWVPRSLKNPTKRKESELVGETEIVGILRLNERRPPFVPKNKLHSDIWYYRDVNAMAEKTDAAPIYLEMTTNSNAKQHPIAGQTKVELRNEHLSYILTWYCLSGATAYMWYYKFIKGMALII